MFDSSSRTKPAPPPPRRQGPVYVPVDRVVDRPVYIDREVEKPVYVDREVEKPVYVDRVVEKPVYVDRVVEKPVYVDKEVRTRCLPPALRRQACMRTGGTHANVQGAATLHHARRTSQRLSSAGVQPCLLQLRAPAPAMCSLLPGPITHRW